jgi:hypothetical protein
MQDRKRPLWKCPKCGERFTGRNMWHSGGKFTLKALFTRSEPRARKIFRKFAKMTRACGPVHMIPQKTRVNNARFQKIETFSPRCHAHYLRIDSEEQLDAEFARWLKQDYALASGNI